MRRCDRVLVGLRTSIVANPTKGEIIASRPEGRRSFSTCSHGEADDVDRGSLVQLSVPAVTRTAVPLAAVVAAGGTTWPVRPRSEK